MPFPRPRWPLRLGTTTGYRRSISLGNSDSRERHRTGTPAFVPGARRILALSDLLSPPITLPAGTSQLSFRHSYDLETGLGATDGYDGGVFGNLRLALAAFADILAAREHFCQRRLHQHKLDSGYANPLAGRAKPWSGNSGGFHHHHPSISPGRSAPGQSHPICAWRCGSDNGVSRTGFGASISLAINQPGVVSACGGNYPILRPVLPNQLNRTMAELATP